MDDNFNPIWIQSLQYRLQYKSLPGRSAHTEMIPTPGRLHEKIRDDSRQAATLLLLCRKSSHGEWFIPLIERAYHPHDRHSGQIAFPGGRIEEEDNTITAAAIREAQEEIGINPLKVRALGHLTPLYVPVSNYLIHPVIGVLTDVPSFTRQESEVHRIWKVPVKELLLPEARVHKTIQIRQGLKLEDVPHLYAGGVHVWGATAMILAEALQVISESQNVTGEN